MENEPVALVDIEVFYDYDPTDDCYFRSSNKDPLQTPLSHDRMSRLNDESVIATIRRR